MGLRGCSFPNRRLYNMAGGKLVGFRTVPNDGGMLLPLGAFSTMAYHGSLGKRCTVYKQLPSEDWIWRRFVECLGPKANSGKSRTMHSWLVNMLVIHVSNMLKVHMSHDVSSYQLSPLFTQLTQLLCKSLSIHHPRRGVVSLVVRPRSVERLTGPSAAGLGRTTEVAFWTEHETLITND